MKDYKMTTHELPEKETIRLSKMMSVLRICSRREADEYIKMGLVSVNGKTAILGQKVTSADKIELKELIKDLQNNKFTVILNKPKGIVSTQPEKNYKEALSLIKPEFFWSKDSTLNKIPKNFSKYKLSCAGRLDIDSHGLLVLTQDGVIAKQIIGEKSQIEKEYVVKVDGLINEEKIKLLKHGIKLDGKNLLPAQVYNTQKHNILRFILKEGKKRQIRRMCQFVELAVVDLKRIRVGNIELGSLPLGKWRILNKNEHF